MRLVVFLALASTTGLLGACAHGGAKKERSSTGTPKAKKRPKRSRDAIAFQREADAIKADGKDVDWEDVAARMQSVADAHPRYGLAWYNLGVAYEHLARPDDAARAYRRAVSAMPSLREAQENLAALALKRGARGEAVEILQDLTARDSGAVHARVALAKHRLLGGHIDEAEQLAKEALAYDPRNIAAYCVLSRASIRRKAYRRARLLIAQGLKIQKKSACLHVVMGVMARKKKEQGVALKAFEQAIKINGSLVEPYLQIAKISMGYKNFARAIESYKKLTAMDPKSLPGFVNLGVAYKGSGQFEKAEGAYQTALKLAEDERSAGVHFNLGVLYLRHLSRMDDAQKHLKRYLQLADGPNTEAAFKMLEEIDQLKAMAEEEKRLEEEAAREAEIERKLKESEKARAAEAGEPAPAEDAESSAVEPEPPDEPPPPAKKPAPKKARRKRSRSKRPPSPAPPKITVPDDDFE